MTITLRWIEGGGPNETLEIAAKRVIRDFNRDMCEGGLITPQTQLAIEALQRALEKRAGERARA